MPRGATVGVLVGPGGRGVGATEFVLPSQNEQAAVELATELGLPGAARGAGLALPSWGEILAGAAPDYQSGEVSYWSGKLRQFVPPREETGGGVLT